MCTDCNCGQPNEQPSRRLEVQRNLLVRNDSVASANRRRFAEAGVRVINLLSSPGSGKTALLERLGRDSPLRERMAVVVGDLATDNDARRLRAAGVRAVPITTGQTCHLEASMVERALAELDLAALDLLVIENVGNLVCPASYDLGESLRVVMLSVTEGEDKPLKYPATFHGADLVVISKLDLAEACGFDRAHAHRHIHQVAPGARIVELSARSGAGMAALHAALEETVLAGVG
jgi:hydrogenase nickel incorporation protein HypB